jgi:phenylacetate-coenzyme A ligase PaaK-like adenylate-forming protein
VSDPVDRWVGERTGLGERLTAETLLDWQLGQVREVLTRVRARSRFFGKRLREVDPASIASLADLQRLPFCSAVDVASDPLSFLCVPQAEVARVTTLTTSGTQGVKKRYLLHREGPRTYGRLLRRRDAGARRARPERPHPHARASESSIGRLLQTALARIGVDSTIGDARWTAMEAIDAARGRGLHRRDTAGSPLTCAGRSRACVRRPCC